MRLSYTALKELKGDYKDVYKTVISSEQKEVGALIDKTKQKVHATDQELYDNIEQLQDIRDEVKKAEEDADKHIRGAV